MHSVPVPINVRCYSNSDIIVLFGAAKWRAKSRQSVPQQEGQLFDYLGGALLEK
jgi:hypothetical protein